MVNLYEKTTPCRSPIAAGHWPMIVFSVGICRGSAAAAGGVHVAGGCGAPAVMPDRSAARTLGRGERGERAASDFAAYSARSNGLLASTYLFSPLLTSARSRSEPDQRIGKNRTLYTPCPVEVSMTVPAASKVASSGPGSSLPGALPVLPSRTRRPVATSQTRKQGCMAVRLIGCARVVA